MVSVYAFIILIFIIVIVMQGLWLLMEDGHDDER